MRKRFSDGRGAARVDKEGDINISFPKRPAPLPGDGDGTADDEYADQVEDTSIGSTGNEAWRFLLAGGIAGAGKSCVFTDLTELFKLSA